MGGLFFAAIGLLLGESRFGPLVFVLAMTGLSSLARITSNHV